MSINSGVTADRKITVTSTVPREWVKIIDDQTTPYMSRSQLVCKIIGEWAIRQPVKTETEVQTS